jgi:hypothetical protein
MPCYVCQHLVVCEVDRPGRHALQKDGSIVVHHRSFSRAKLNRDPADRQIKTRERRDTQHRRHAHAVSEVAGKTDDPVGVARS